MSTPVRRSTGHPNVLDYAPRHVREGRGPRPVEEDATQPFAVDDEPLEETGSEDEEDGDTSLAPQTPHDGHEGEADWDRDEGTNDPGAHRPHTHDLDAPMSGSKEPNSEDEFAHLASLLESIRRDSDDLSPTTPPRRTGALPRGSERESGLYIDGLRVPRSLQPSYMPPPPEPEHRRGYLGIIFSVTFACLVAGVLTYVVAGGWYSSTFRTAAQLISAPAHDGATTAAAQPTDRAAKRAPQPATTPTPYSVASAGPAVAAPPAAATRETKVASLPPATRTAPTMRVAPWPTETPASAAPNTPPVAPSPPASQAQPPSPPQPAIDPQEVKLLLEQGKQFITAGDVATARSVLQRVADAGVAAGALELAKTYDPAVLAEMGVRGLQGDVNQARHWYERAQQLGSDEAAHHLALMAQQ